MPPSAFSLLHFQKDNPVDEYPKYLFHRDLPARVVANPEQHLALGGAWAETPDAFKEPAIDAPPVAVIAEPKAAKAKK